MVFMTWNNHRKCWQCGAHRSVVGHWKIYRHETRCVEVLILHPKCTKRHLRASIISKFFPGVIPPDSRQKGEGRRGWEGKGKEGKRKGKGRGGSGDRKGRRGEWKGKGKGRWKEKEREGRKGRGRNGKGSVPAVLFLQFKHWPLPHIKCILCT